MKISTILNILLSVGSIVLCLVRNRGLDISLIAAILLPYIYVPYVLIMLLIHKTIYATKYLTDDNISEMVLANIKRKQQQRLSSTSTLTTTPTPTPTQTQKQRLQKQRLQKQQLQKQRLQKQSKTTAAA